MQINTRIPTLPNNSFFAMNRWFYKMYQADLLYHPDERAENIVNIESGQPTFTTEECSSLNAAIDLMFEKHGDRVYEIGLRYAYKSMGIKPQ